MLLTEQQIAELAAQNQQLLAVIEDIGDFAHDRSTGPAVEDGLWEVRRLAYDVLSFSDRASQHLNRVKAEALRDAADEFDAQGEWKGHGQQLRNMADAIEKGEGL